MTTTRASAAAANVANTEEAATVASKQDATTTPTMQPNDAAEYVAETSANKPSLDQEAPVEDKFNSPNDGLSDQLAEMVTQNELTDDDIPF